MAAVCNSAVCTVNNKLCWWPYYTVSQKTTQLWNGIS